MYFFDTGIEKNAQKKEQLTDYIEKTLEFLGASSILN